MRKSWTALQLLRAWLLVVALAAPIEGRGRGKRHLRITNHPEDSYHDRKLWLFDNEWSFFGLKDAFKRWNQQWIIPTQGQEMVDVIIIGAGMAGLAAAAELQNIDSTKSFLILESTGSIGGRVRSTTFGDNNYVVEDGANWLYDNNGLPTSGLASAQGVQTAASNYLDYTMYDTTGTAVASSTAQARQQAFLSAFNDAERDANNLFSSSENDGFSDTGVVALLSNNGWAVAADSSGNMDYIFQWLYIDFEYAASDTSVRFFPYINDAPLMVVDQRGYQNVLQEFKNANIGDDKFRMNKRVSSIDYDTRICDGQVTACECCGEEFNAIVRTTDGSEYMARRVISTVSAGVLSSGDISFNPGLKYSDSPYNFAQYIKVFYQFSSKFWDSTQFVYTMKDVANRGQCHHWQDMDSLISGSRILRCELMTEAFLALLDSSTQELSATTLNSLLDPLRLAYGTNTVGTPIATYYPKLNKDADFGYGAYANWKIGKSFTDFAKYFGGINNLAAVCDHNGCNSQGDWILHFSGAASCFEHAEFVHGAFYSGQRSARWVLNSLGVEGVNTDNSECDVSWSEFGSSDIAAEDCETP